MQRLTYSQVCDLAHIHVFKISHTVRTFVHAHTHKPHKHKNNIQHGWLLLLQSFWLFLASFLTHTHTHKLTGRIHASTHLHMSFPYAQKDKPLHPPFFNLQTHSSVFFCLPTRFTLESPSSAYNALAALLTVCACVLCHLQAQYSAMFEFFHLPIIGVLKDEFEFSRKVCVWPTSLSCFRIAGDKQLWSYLHIPLLL
jgi:hypothetical protein